MRKPIAITLLLAMFLTLCSFPVTADQLSEIQNKKQNIDSQLSQIERKKTETQKKLQQIETQKEQLLSAENQRSKEYEELLKEFEAVQQEIQSIEQTIQDTEAEYQRQRDLYAKRLKAMYQVSGISAMETLLNSTSLLNFFERLEYLVRISQKDTKLLEELEAAKKDHELKKMEMELIRKELSDRAKQLQQNIEQLKTSRAAKESEIRRLNMTLEEYERQEDELIRISAELARSIQALMSKNTTYASGAMVWPSAASRTITSPYGMRLHPILRVYKLHTGIDIGAGFGTSILAAQKGTVIVAGWQNGYGNTVIIDHGGGVATLYAHASKILVKVGDKVEAGSVIALVGSTGWSTGPHLHFEVIVNGATTNPLNYVKP